MQKQCISPQIEYKYSCHQVTCVFPRELIWEVALPHKGMTTLKNLVQMEGPYIYHNFENLFPMGKLQKPFSLVHT